MRNLLSFLAANNPDLDPTKLNCDWTEKIARTILGDRQGQQVLAYVRNNTDKIVDLILDVASLGQASPYLLGQVVGRIAAAGKVAKTIQKGMKGAEHQPHQGRHEPAPVPNFLPAFPNAKRVDPKSAVQGGGSKRPRWKDGKYIYEFDRRHNTVEKYSWNDKKHLGEYDYKTGKQLKEADPKRRIEK